MKYFVIICLFLLSFESHADDGMTLNVESDKPFFVVSLPSNPTTGYQWVLKKYDKDLLKIKTTEYLPPKNNLMGAGGVMTFQFAPLKGKRYPDKTIMLFEYLRPWEQKPGTLKKVIINFCRPCV